MKSHTAQSCLTKAPGLTPGRLSLALSFALLALGSASALAQDQQEEDSRDAKTLSSVKVQSTANSAVVSQGALGDLSDLRTPFSTVEADAGKIADLQPASVFGLFQDDASVSRQRGGDFNAWSGYLTIRGVAVDSTSGSTKLNGLPTMLFGVSLPTEMMQSVKILKGASGFLYGFAAPGGIVDYITKKPPESFLLSADVGYRENNVFQEHVDVGDRLDGPHNFGYRFNATHQEGTTNRGTGVNRDAAAASLDMDLTPTLRLTADAIYQKSHLDREVPMVFLSQYNGTRLPHINSDVVNAQSENSYSDNTFWEFNTGLFWQISDNWSLRADVAKSRTETVYSRDYLYMQDSSGRYRDATYDGYSTYEFKMARAMLEGKFDLGPTQHNVVIGTSYQTSDAKRGYSELAQGYVSRGYRNLLDYTPLVYTPTYGSNQNTYPYNGDKQNALFASDTIDFGQHWSTILGVRYTHYTQYSYSGYAFSDGDSGSNYSATRTPYSAYSTSPMFALMYKPNDWATAYVSYVEALEPGQTVGAANANYGEQLSPVTSEQFEVGFKLEKGTVDASAAIFRLDRGTGYTNADNYYVQDGTSRYQGLDTNASWRINPSVRLSASWVYLDKAVAMDVGDDFLNGKPVAGAFHSNGALGVDYSPQWLPGVSVNFNARATGKVVNYQSTRYQQTVTVPGYTLYNLGFKFDQPYGAHQLTYRVGINNLTDKVYWIGASGAYTFIGDPRSAYANVTFDF